MLKVYDNFDPDIIAYYDDVKVEALLNDKGIIRSKLKVGAAIHNAKIYLKMRDEEGIDFSEHLWSFVGGNPIVNRWEKSSDAPVKSPESEAMSKDLKKRGFKFVGPVILYAFMQAVGMINDHIVTCHSYDACL